MPNFNRLFSLKLPSNLDEVEEGVFQCRFFLLGEGRYFYYDVVYKTPSKSERKLVVFDLHFNKIDRTYTFEPIRSEFKFTSIFVSDFAYIPLNLKQGLIFTSKFIHEVELDDVKNEIRPIGSKYVMEDCSEVVNLQVVNTDQSKMILLAFRSKSTREYIASFRALNNPGNIICEFKLPGETGMDYRSSSLYATIFKDKLYVMMCKNNLSNSDFVLYKKSDSDNSTSMELVEMKKIPNNTERSRPFISGTWRSHTFICSVHWTNSTNPSQCPSCIYLFDINTKEWKKLFGVFNRMVSLLIEIDSKPDTALIFSSIEMNESNRIKCLDRVYRLPARNAEKLENLCRFKSISFGLFDHRVSSWKMFRELEIQLQQRRNFKLQIDEFERKVKLKRRNLKLQLDELDKKIESKRDDINEAQVRDRSAVLPPKITFQLPEHLLTEE